MYYEKLGIKLVKVRVIFLDRGKNLSLNMVRIWVMKKIEF